MMLGTLANTSTIIVGSIVGSILKKGIPERFQNRTMEAMGLVAIAIGISNISQGMKAITNPVIFILSIALGALLGEFIDLDGKVEKFTKKFEGKNSPAQGIIIGTVLFCVGALSIVGPIQSALRGDNTMLFANAVLDGITSVILSINYGISIIFIAVILFIWQGLIYFGASMIGSSLSGEILNQLTLLGGIFIFATGVNILGLGKIKTLNLIPALLVLGVFKIVGLV